MMALIQYCRSMWLNQCWWYMDWQVCNVMNEKKLLDCLLYTGMHTRYCRCSIVKPVVPRRWSINLPGVATRMSILLSTIGRFPPRGSSVSKACTIFECTFTSSPASAETEDCPTARPTERPTAGAIVSKTAFTWEADRHKMNESVNQTYSLLALMRTQSYLNQIFSLSSFTS